MFPIPVQHNRWPIIAMRMEKLSFVRAAAPGGGLKDGALETGARRSMMGPKPVLHVRTGQAESNIRFDEADPGPAVVAPALSKRRPWNGRSPSVVAIERIGELDFHWPAPAGIGDPVP